MIRAACPARRRRAAAAVLAALRAAAACCRAPRTSTRRPGVGAASGSSTTAGCAPAGWPTLRRAGRPAGRARSARPACCWSGATTASCAAFANICRHRGHELLACGASDEPRRRSSARTTRGATSSTARCASRPLRRRPRLRPVRVSGSSPVRSEEWGGWVFVNVSGDAPRRSRTRSGSLGRLVAPYECERLVVGARRTPTSSRPTGRSPHENYHECYHCPLIHPELVPGQPARLG